MPGIRTHAAVIAMPVRHRRGAAAATAALLVVAAGLMTAQPALGAVETYSVLGGPNSGEASDGFIATDAKGYSCITGSYNGPSSSVPPRPTQPFQIPPLSVPTNESSGVNRAYVALLDPQGKAIWTKHFVASVVVTSFPGQGVRQQSVKIDGKACVVAGSFTGVADFGGGVTKQGAVPELPSAYVARLSRKDGGLLGVETLTSPFGEVAGGYIVLDKQGGAYLAGAVAPSVNDAPGQQYAISGFPQVYQGGGADIMLAYWKNGAWTWVRTFGGTGGDFSMDLAMSKNRLALGFISNSPTLAFGGKTQPLTYDPNDPVRSMGLALFDPKTCGALVAWNFGGIGTGMAAIATDKAGDIYMSGQYTGIAYWGYDKRGVQVTTTSTVDVYEPYLVKFTIRGLKHYVAWATSFPANDSFSNNGGTDVALLKSGKYVYVSGFHSSSTLSVGTTTLANELSPPYTRVFVAQLDAKTGAAVAASNQLAPAMPYASAFPTISLDGKGRLHIIGPLLNSGMQDVAARTLCNSTVIPDPSDSISVYTAIISSISCKPPAKRCTGAKGCPMQP